jgi:hypothetical protein
MLLSYVVSYHVPPAPGAMLTPYEVKLPLLKQQRINVRSLSMSTSLDDILNFLKEHWPRINRNQDDLKNYFLRKRENAETERDRDLKKSVEHLLADIHDESLDDQSRDHQMTVARTMARFASLLTLLSKQADKQFRQNMCIQRWLIGLTVALVVLTIALLILTWKMVPL